MPVWDLYSFRQAPSPEVFVFDSVPDMLRVQVWNIVRNTIGNNLEEYSSYNVRNDYKQIEEIVANEHGKFTLSRERIGYDSIRSCLLNDGLSIWLDLLEFCLRVAITLYGKDDEDDRKRRGAELSPKAAVEELNQRFRRAGFGYRFENDRILRIDDEFTFAEAAVPALNLLSDPRFKGANEEFLAAHKHYKAGENKDAAVDALNALESTMKAICDIRGWTYPKGARASDLVDVLKKNGLFPAVAERSFDQLVATLKSGLPTLRNDTGGHGQGSEIRIVPDAVAAYALNLAASKIRLLVELLLESEATGSKGGGR